MGESRRAEVVWTGVGFVYARSVSGDGRWITYADWVPFDLHVYDSTTGEDRNLTGPPDQATTAWRGMAMDAQVSPDGSRIAYGWWGASYDLRVGRIDEPAEAMARPLGDTPWAAIHNWSADGRHVLLSDYGNQRTILYDAERGTSVEVPSAYGRLYLSPGGKRIAGGGCGSEGRADIWVRSVDDVVSDIRVSGDSHDLLFGWSPDGHDLVFASDRSGTLDLYAVDASPGSQAAPRLLRRDIAANLEPMGVGFDGSCFFIASASRNTVYQADLDPTTGLIGALEVVDDAAGDQTSVDWSPDGSLLAYLRDGGPHFASGSTRCLVLVGESEIRHVPSLEAGHYPGSHPMKLWWGPMGDTLFGAGFHGSGRGLYRVDATTGSVDVLATVGVVTGGPRESVAPLPDPEAVVYRRVDVPPGAGEAESGGQAIVVRLLDSGAERVIYGNEREETVSHLTTARDGSMVAFLSSSETGVDDDIAFTRIKVVPVAGGTARVVASCEAPEWISTLAWMPDGESILFGRQRGSPTDGVLEVLRVPVAGGEPVACGVRLESATLFSMRVHPSGRRVALSAGRICAGEVRVVRDCLAPQA